MGLEGLRSRRHSTVAYAVWIKDRAANNSAASNKKQYLMSIPR